MNTVKATPLPIQSLLADRVQPKDFVDCYSVESDLSARQAAEIVTNFPGWARFLVSLRNLLTLPFGLVADAPAEQEKLGIFPVETDSRQEVIVGFNDKHLNFRVSVMSQEGKVFLATWVHTNNLGGKIYLNAILPFHILIVRNALARVRAAS